MCHVWVFKQIGIALVIQTSEGLDVMHQVLHLRNWTNVSDEEIRLILSCIEKVSTCDQVIEVSFPIGLTQLNID